MNDVEKTVRDFYDNFGWQEAGEASGEDVLFRQFSRPYYHYHAGVDARTMACFSGLDGKLLMAGGGDLPDIHIAIAQKFSATICLDISRKAIQMAEERLQSNGEFILGSILEVPKPDDHFDAVFCSHVIYHIDKDLQETAIREFIRVTKPGGRIVIIYSNPKSLARRLTKLKIRVPLLRRIKRKVSAQNVERPPLYFFAHPLEWWSRFKNECDVRLIPWDVVGSEHERHFFLSDGIARNAYRFCSWFENRYPDKAVRWWAYPVILLDKKSGS